jgi:hypothetical protein
MLVKKSLAKDHTFTSSHLACLFKCFDPAYSRNTALFSRSTQHNHYFDSKMAHTLSSRTKARQLRSSNQRSDNSVDALPSQHVARATARAIKDRERAVPSRDRLARRANAKGEEQSTARVDDASEAEDEGDTIMLQPPTNRKTASQAVAAAAEKLSKGDKDKKSVRVPKRSPPPGHTILIDLEEMNQFIAFVPENNGLSVNQHTFTRAVIC